MPLLKESINEDDGHMFCKRLVYVLAFETTYPDMDLSKEDPVALVKRILMEFKAREDVRFKNFKEEMVDRDHPWIKGCMQKLKSVFEDTTKLSRNAIYVRMLNSPHVDPREIQ